MDLGLRNLNALVTGATRGIGRACATLLAAEGANVSICARNADQVARARDALSGMGVTAYGAACDVSDKAQLENWVLTSVEALGGIDIVIANASSMVGDDSEESWRTAFDSDLMQCVRLSNAALPHLRRSAHGAITFISSVSARQADGSAASYGAMKLALHRYAKDLAGTLAADGIRVNTLSPGTTYFDGGFWQMVEQDDPDMFAKAMQANPMGRMATAGEMAQSVVFLSSPASGFTSGANLVVDGNLSSGVQL